MDTLSQFLINLKQDKIIAIGFNIACTFCPCFLTLFFFDNQLFQILDTIKLVLLCFSIGLPFLLLSLYMTIGVSSDLKHLVTSFLEMNAFDRFKVTHDKIDMITKDLSTRFVAGLVGSISWLITGLITAISSLFVHFEQITTYGYLISLIYIVVLITISWIGSFIFKTLAEALDKKNDKDYAKDESAETDSSGAIT